MLDTLTTITEAADSGRPTGLAFPLELRRAWPRDSSRLGLQYTDATGSRVPAQWHADSDRTVKVWEKTRHGPRPAVLASAGDVIVVLQPDGSDSKLPALDRLLGAPDASLVTHRPGRRAVVRIQRDGSARYVKAVRPSRSARIVESNRIVAGMPDRAFATPVIEGIDEAAGVLETREVVGQNLHDLLALNPDRFVQGCHAAGVALRSLHSIETDAVPAHDAISEISMLSDRCRAVERFTPEFSVAVFAALETVSNGLRSSRSAHKTIHRDYYDKQIVIGPGGIPALLDFDTLGLGEPALDIANMLVHLELRVLQGNGAPQTAASAAEAFLKGYETSAASDDRLRHYLDASRLRLAILYAFWPKWTGVARELLATIGTPFLQSATQRVTLSSGTHRSQPGGHDALIGTSTTDTSGSGSTHWCSNQTINDPQRATGKTLETTEGEM